MRAAIPRQCQLAVLILFFSAPGVAFSQSFHGGPLFDHFPLTLSLGERTEAAGPFFASEEQPAQRGWAVPPLLSHTWYTDVDGEEVDFLYPCLTYDRYGQEYLWQFLQVVSFSGGQTQQDGGTRRAEIFPIYFHRRSPNPADDYTAVLPFYGTIKHKFLRDEIHVVLFPFYVETRKKDVVTDNYLFPFFDLRRGDGLHGWQFWPLVGAEHKVLTSRTNDFGTVETVPGHDKFFALWPLYFHDDTGLGTDNPERFRAFLPLYAFTRSPQRDVSAYLWPFFSYTDDRAQKYREWDFPWPLFVIARGEGKTLTRFIPVYSRGFDTNMESQSYLWPVFTHHRDRAPALVRDRTKVLFWVYSKLDETNVAAGTTKRRLDGWPLFTYTRGHEGNTRLQIFAPLEPIVPSSKSVQRNLSPLWTLWRSERNAANGATSQSLLWNLYRRDTTPKTRRTSLLLGLFQYQSGPEEKRLKLCFIPISKKKQTP